MTSKQPFYGRVAGSLSSPALVLWLVASLIACQKQSFKIAGQDIGANINGIHQSLNAISGTLRISPAASLAQTSDANASLCGDPAQVVLYQAAGDTLGKPLASAAVAGDGSFTFADVQSLGVFLNQGQAYVLASTGCGRYYSRVVTGASNQDLTSGSTLVAYALTTTLKADTAVDVSQLLKMASLSDQLATPSTVADAYSALVGDTAMGSLFQSVFHIDAATLKEMPPVILALTMPAAVAEREPAAFSVSAVHWDPSYKVAFLWKRDNQVAATTANYTYTPDANSQGAHTVALYVGRADDQGALDLTKSYQSKATPVTVGNQVVATAPALELASHAIPGSTPPRVRRRDLTLTLLTGTGLSNCESFSSLALTENNSAPPVDPRAYNITCAANGTSDTQPVTYSLTSSGDGAKHLRLWARDAAGNISPNPTTLDLMLDTAPLGGFTVTSPAEPTTNRSPVLTWSQSTGATAYDVRLGTTSDCSSPLATFTQVTGTSVSLPSLAYGHYDLCLTATDDDGYQTLATGELTIVMPTVAFSAPLPGGFTDSANVAAFAVSGTCSESGQQVTVVAAGTGGGTPTVSLPCTTGHWSGSIDLSGFSDASITLTATHISAAGDAATPATVTIAKDTAAPVVTLTPPAVYANAATAGAFAAGGTCSEAGQTVTVTATDPGSGVTHTQGTCVAGAWTASLDLTSLSEGTLSITAAQTDAAGNEATSAASLVTKDTVQPVAAVTPPGMVGPNSTSGPTTQLGGSASDSGSGLASVDVSVQQGSGSCLNAGLTAFDASCPTWHAATGMAAWTWAVNDSLMTEAQIYHVSSRGTDLAGNVQATPGSVDLTWHAAAPTFTSLSLNSGATSSATNYLAVSLAASDTLANTSAFCLKYNVTTTPAAADSCWIPVNAPSPGLTPALTLSFTGFSFPVGFTPGNYTVYAWAKDATGNISTLTAAGAGTDGVDKATIAFTPGSPPVVVNVLAANSDAPANPPTTADLNLTLGHDVYIKWKATASNPISATPVSLSYTTDDINYTTIASGLTNGANGACQPDDPATAADDGDTGCYVWMGGGPTSNFFRVRMTVTDNASMTTYAGSSPLNVSEMSFIAGNTETGLGSSATSAVFFNYTAQATTPDTGSLLVTPDGTIYFRDYQRGILTVSPTDGLVKVLIPTTGNSTGDGGPISSATLKAPYRIALDYQNRILVFDYDRIRRIDTQASPMTISTIIGGGSDTSDTAAALAVQISPSGWDNSPNIPFYVLPNGKIYFATESYYFYPIANYRIRIYDPTTGLVSSIHPGGTGDTADPAVDIGNCVIAAVWLGFDQTTSAVTRLILNDYHDNQGAASPNCATHGGQGFVSLDLTTYQSTTPRPDSTTYISYWYLPIQARDGSIYLISRLVPGIVRYDDATHKAVLLVGTGTPGSCVDGTPALSCAIDPEDAFVSAAGTLYFMDRGRLRTIDASGNVITLFGQGLSYGDGGQAASARFHVVNSLAVLNDDSVIVLDQQEARFRQFTPGGTITTIAGNGSNAIPDTVQPATAQGLILTVSGPYWDDFAANPANGDIYYNRGDYIAKLDHSTGTWVNLVGGAGTTPYFDPTADGMPGNSIALSYYPPRILGFDGTNLLAARGNFDVQFRDKMLKLYSVADGTQAPLLGEAGVSTYSVCADGTPGSSCTVPDSYGIYYTHSSYDGLSGKWLLLFYTDSQAIRTIAPGGNIGTLATLPRPALSFAYRHDASNNVIYYCATDGHLYKYDLAAGNVDTALAWPISTMSCTGRTLAFDSANNLVFPYTHNGLYGIAKYLAP